MYIAEIASLAFQNSICVNGVCSWSSQEILLFLFSTNIITDTLPIAVVLYIQYTFLNKGLKAQ